MEDAKIEKKLLLKKFNSLAHSLDYDDKKYYNEKEIEDVLKIKLKESIKVSINNFTPMLFLFF